MYPEYDDKTLKIAARAHAVKDWKALLDINLSMLEAHPGNEFLLWHIADTYLKLGDIDNAVEFAEKIKDSTAHKDDIMTRAMYLVQPKMDDKEAERDS